MKVSAVHFLWVLLLAAFVMGVAGCASDDPDNDSVRPWGVPQDGGTGAMPIQSEQHAE
jgi:hypothetical protein